MEALPVEIEGIDLVEYLVVDDGSSDNTAEAARRAGVHHLVILPHHMGLATAFKIGLESGLVRGADIIVNTDADNQYNAGDIRLLVEPILTGRADIVVGDRGVGSLQSFSFTKRLLQRMGSWTIGQASGLEIAPCRKPVGANDNTIGKSCGALMQGRHRLECRQAFDECLRHK